MADRRTQCKCSIDPPEQSSHNPCSSPTQQMDSSTESHPNPHTTPCTHRITHPEWTGSSSAPFAWTQQMLDLRRRKWTGCHSQSMRGRRECAVCAIPIPHSLLKHSLDTTVHRCTTQRDSGIGRDCQPDNCSRTCSYTHSQSSWAAPFHWLPSEIDSPSRTLPCDRLTRIPIWSVLFSHSREGKVMNDEQDNEKGVHRIVLFCSIIHMLWPFSSFSSICVERASHSSHSPPS